MPACNRPKNVLVTGFGPFPGAPRNPSAVVVAALERHRAGFARHGLALETRTLPVLYEICGAFPPESAPDFIVAVGVANSRKRVCVETIARARRSSRHPDASGRPPKEARNGARDALPIDPRWNASALAVALAGAGVPAQVSRDAGSYLCNALLYRALEAGPAPALFIHIPPARKCPPERIAAALVRTLPHAIGRFARRTTTL